MKKIKQNKLIMILLLLISLISLLKILIDNTIVDKNKIIHNLIGETINSSSVIRNKIKENISKPTEIIYTSLNKIVPKNNLDIYSNVDDDFDYGKSNTDYVEDPNPIEVDKPIVYIYNTHQLEEYSNNNIEDYSIKPNVMIASYIIRENLNKLGINALVETGNIKEYLNNNSLKYSYSYDASKYYMLNAIKENPTLKYFVDIHRDSSKIEKTLYKKDNKEYARILFIVGLENPNYEKNLQITTELNEMFESDNKGISRGIYKKSGAGVNGVYNQDIDENVILIEVGGVDNTIEQVNNTCELIAKYLAKYIGEHNG